MVSQLIADSNDTRVLKCYLENNTVKLKTLPSGSTGHYARLMAYIRTYSLHYTLSGIFNEVFLLRQKLIRAKNPLKILLHISFFSSSKWHN